MRKDDNLQISVELVDARDNTQVWGSRYNRRMADLLVTQSEISKEIATRLSSRLTNAGQSQLAKQNVDPQAYELVLRGRHAFRQFTPESTKKAAEYYEQAIQIEPQYALAYAEVATVYRILGVLSVEDPQIMNPKAEAATLKALELDDELAEAHSSLAGIKRDCWDWDGAEREYRKAIDLNPNFVDAYEGYAIYLSILGRHDTAIAEMRSARDRDPLRLLTNLSYGAVFYNARRYDEALAIFEKARELDKNAPAVYAWLGITHAAKGAYPQAIAAYREAARLGDNTTSTQGYFAYALAMSGQKGEAEEILRRLKNATDFVPPVPLAIAYAGFGNKEEALKTLESALESRDPSLQYLNVEPHLDSLQNEPRFREIVRKVGLSS
jgi:tetratricopeptide (TPR) repeat protein